MSLSLSAAVKARIEATVSDWRPSTVSGCPVFRDDAPQGQVFPYITITEGLGTTPSTTTRGVGTEIVQVDVWQQWKPKTPDDVSAGFDGQHKENPLLGPNLTRELHEAQFQSAPQRVLFTSVVGAIRMTDRDANIVHTAITLWVRRVL